MEIGKILKKTLRNQENLKWKRMISRLALWSTVDTGTTSKKYFWSNFDAVQRAQLGLWKVCGHVCTYQLVSDTNRPALPHKEVRQEVSLKTAWQHLYYIVSLRKLLIWCVFSSPHAHHLWRLSFYLPLHWLTDAESLHAGIIAQDLFWRFVTLHSYIHIDKLDNLDSLCHRLYGILTFWTNQFKL